MGLVETGTEREDSREGKPGLHKNNGQVLQDTSTNSVELRGIRKSM